MERLVAEVQMTMKRFNTDKARLLHLPNLRIQTSKTIMLIDQLDFHNSKRKYKKNIKISKAMDSQHKKYYSNKKKPGL